MYSLVIFISSLLYVFIRVKKNMQIFQQNFYNENNRYIKWGFKHLDKVFSIYDVFMVIVNIINIFVKNKFLIFVNVFYLLLYVIYNGKLKKEQVKLALVFSKRVKRLFVSYFILLIILILLLYDNVYLFNVIYSMVVLINFYVLYLVNIINKPIDKAIYYHYYNVTMKKLKSLTNLEVIGVTGSYGKTSTKNFLNEILNIKYNCLATPKNYNTKYGLMITINEYLNKYNDFLIAEMGAYKMGSIESLCKMVKPKYGIITTIGLAHLETFGSEENIQKGKFELIDSLPSDGVAILNADDPHQVNYEIKSNCKRIWIGINNKDAMVRAKDINIMADGMHFNIYFKDDDKEYEFYTRMLGFENIYNILDAVAFGKYKGLTIKELQYGVRMLKPIPHRLELKRINDKKVIIDDAYNSNPTGSKMALEVLGKMDGTKIIVTPGMIELGKDEYELNKKFGEYISEVCDYVILVGKKQTKPIYDGLMSNNFDEKKLFIINDVKEAFKLVDDIESDKIKYILLENDCPDIFNE